MTPHIKNNHDYLVEIKIGANSWFWCLIYKNTVMAVGKKYYTKKQSAKRAFENMFGVVLKTKQRFGDGEYRETYNIF